MTVEKTVEVIDKFRTNKGEIRQRSLLRVGVIIAQGPPVPIPNTEVKLCGAEDTCLATDRENRSMPTQMLKNAFRINS